MSVDESYRPADVGMLFVHGIGAQRRGEGLNEAGNALYRWFRSSRGVAGLGDAVVEIGTVKTWGDEPANAELLLSLPNGRQRWLLAESHWADVFLPPSTASTLVWTFKVSPGLLLSRAVESLVYAFAAWSANPLHWWRILFAVLWVVAVVPVSLVLIVSLTLLILLRFLIPIAAVKDALAKLEVILTSRLGDSFMFTENAISRSAMISKVRSETDWLGARAERVVVVAHSQGAAVTVHALGSGAPVDTLITFGAGISQLQWVRSGSENTATKGMRWLLLFGWLGLLLVYAVAAYQFARLAAGEPLQPFLWAITLVGWVPLAAFSVAIYKELFSASRQARVDLVPQNVAERWWDVWASADPVSGGPSTSWSYGGVSEFRAFNAGNVLTDHTAYYRNQEDFVGRVAAAGLITPQKRTRTAYADTLQSWQLQLSTLRLRRGRWLEIWRLSMLAIFAALVWRFSGYAREEVGDIVEGVRLPPDWVSWSRLDAVQIALTLLILAGVVAVVYLLGTLFWKAWGLVDADAAAGISLGREPLDPDRQITSRVQLAFLAIGASLPWVAVAAAFGIFLGAFIVVEVFILAFSGLGIGIVAYMLSLPVNAIIRRIVVRDAAQRSRVKAAAMYAWVGAVPVWAATFGWSLRVLDPDTPVTDTYSLTWPEVWIVAAVMLLLTWLFTGLRISRGVPRSRSPLLLRFVQNPVTYQPVKYSTLYVPNNRVWAAGVAAVIALQLVVIITLPIISADAQVIAVGFAGVGGFFFGFGAIAVAADMDSRWGKIVGGVAAAAVLVMSVAVFVRVFALLSS